MRIKTDPVEKSREYKKIKHELEEQIRKEIGQSGYMGYCHKYWNVKKRILKEKYGIDWQSPAELNMHINFD